MPKSSQSSLLTPAGEQTIALFLSYGAALAVGHALGGGAAGAGPLALGVAVVIGVLARAGRFMNGMDATAVAAAHIGVATAFGVGPNGWAPMLAGDLAASSVGAALFVLFRRTGRVDSQPALATAACLTAALAVLAGVLTRFAASGGWAEGVAALPAAWAHGALPVALCMIAMLTHGRSPSRPAAAGEPEPSPSAVEYLICGGVALALTLAAVADDRPTPVLAASLALLWFALRYGSFQASAAAFAFSTGLLALGRQGAWVGFADLASPLAGDFSRAVTAALLTLPSVFVAAVVSDQRRLKLIYAYEASHDGLTRLANRTRFGEVIDRTLAAAASHDKRFVLMLIDLDHFKSVNDTHGHVIGDRLLIEVADRLRASVRSSDLVARLGGDEFAVIAPVSSISDAMTMARRLVTAVNQPCDFDAFALSPSITLGGALSPDSSLDRDELIRLADEALYEAKRAGRNTWRFTSGDRIAAQDVTWVDGGDLVIEGDTVLLD